MNRVTVLFLFRNSKSSDFNIAAKNWVSASEIACFIHADGSRRLTCARGHCRKALKWASEEGQDAGASKCQGRPNIDLHDVDTGGERGRSRTEVITSLEHQHYFAWCNLQKFEVQSTEWDDNAVAQIGLQSFVASKWIQTSNSITEHECWRLKL